MQAHPYANAAYHTVQETGRLITRPFAIALRGRVMLLAAMGVLAIYAVDALAVEQSADAKVLAWTGLRGWYQLQGIYLGFVEPFVQLVQGEAILANLLRCVVRLAVWGMLGGVIARIAVLNLTRGEDPNLVGSLKYVWRRKGNFLGAPGLLLAGLFLLGLPLVAARLLMQVSWIAPVIAVLWPVVIAIGVVATIYALGALVGWPVMTVAAAADQSDSFDSVSRVYAYTFQKPLRFMAYLGVTAALMTVAATAGTLFAAAVGEVSNYAVAETPSPWAAQVANGWMTVASTLVVVYLTAQFWTSAAGIYLLRRRDVDAVPTDEVFIDSDEFGGTIPALKRGEDGVPEFADHKADAA